MDITPAKAIGYFREETPQREDLPSLTEQNRAFLEFCRREKLDIGATFLDTSTAQTGFRQMVEYLQRDAGDVVVVVDSLHRLGHDIRQTARAYFQLSSLRVRIMALNRPGDGLESLLASWDTRDSSERTGERVRDAMRRKAIKGEVLGRLPYGYRIGPRRRLAPEPDEAEVVRSIFQLYTSQGLGIRLIARWLNEHGYSTRRGGKWSMVTIRDILRNRVYLGTYERFGVRVPGSHPSIISPSDFRRAEDRLTRRRSTGERRQRIPFLLSGLLQCGYCGNHMIGVSRHQGWRRQADGQSVEAEYRYYQCETRTNQSMCDYHTRRAPALEEEVRMRLEAQLEERIRLPLAASEGDASSQLAHLHSRRRQLDRRIEQLLTAGATGQLSTDQVQTLSVDVAHQQLAFDGQIAELERRVRECRDHAQRVSEFQLLLQDLAPERWQTLDHSGRQQLVSRLIEHVVVHDEEIQLVPRAI